MEGNYTLQSFFSSAKGPFTISGKTLVAYGNASLIVNREGKVRTDIISIDFKIGNLETNFENLGKDSSFIFAFFLEFFVSIFRLRWFWCICTKYAQFVTRFHN